MAEITLETIKQAIRDGDKKKARELAASYLKHNKNDADVWYLAARLATNKTQAIVCLEKAIQIDPFHESANSFLEKLTSEDEQPKSNTVKEKRTQSTRSTENLSQILTGAVAIAFIIMVGLILYTNQQRSQNESTISVLPTQQPMLEEVNSSSYQTFSDLPTPTVATRPTLPPTFTPIPPTSAPPTLRPQPTEEFGTRQNPYPFEWNTDLDGYASVGIAGDSYIAVIDARPVSNNVIENWNMFNELADSNETWLLVSLGAACLKDGNESCYYSSFDFNLIGSSGRTYSPGFVTGIPNEFSGEVYGEGNLFGSLAFLVSKNDSDFVLVYEQMFGGNYFFEVGERPT